MKKVRLLGLIVALLSAGLVSAVSAAPYVSGNFGFVSVSDSSVSGAGPSAELSLDPGFGFLAAVGNGFDRLRAEVELAYRSNDLDKISSGGALNGKITSSSVMGDLLLDLDLSESVRPFLGAGMGLANLEAKSNDLGNADDTVFAYQLIAGLGVPVSHVTTLDLQYRFFATEDPDFSGSKAEYQTHNFFAGLRFDF